MQALGVIEMIGENVAFEGAKPLPARPTARDAFNNSVLHSSRKSKGEGIVDSAAAASFTQALVRARLALGNSRNSTTLAILAQTLQACAYDREAVDVANEALNTASLTKSGHLVDPVSIRVAIEVLLRAHELDRAAHVTTSLPVDAQAALLVAAALADAGKYKKALDIINHVDSEDKDPLLAFVLLSEGRDKEAIPLLRSALRRRPADADSAHNLSIAFLRSGSHKKAIAASLRATRAAPGRQDLSMFYLKLLLESGRSEAVITEVRRLAREGVEPVAELAVVQARAWLDQGDIGKAERYLTLAGEIARKSGDEAVLAEVLSNLVRLRVLSGRLKRDVALKSLVKLHHEFPASTAVVANIAQVAERRSDVGILRRALADVRQYVEPARAAYIEFQIATLDGDNVGAANKAAVWWTLEPKNAYAASAAMVASGIGCENWEFAAEVAQRAYVEARLDPNLVNNAAYVIAMAGYPSRAIEMLEPEAQDNPILKATLGLAYLAARDVPKGMRLYREAAEAVSVERHAFRSLMTMYQALVVRQLGLEGSTDKTMLRALALPPVGLPDDWAQRAEFLRLHFLARRHGYSWPLEL